MSAIKKLLDERKDLLGDIDSLQRKIYQESASDYLLIKNYAAQLLNAINSLEKFDELMNNRLEKGKE